MKADDMIIRRPELLTGPQKVAEAGITLIFWLILIYLWQPLLSLIAWVFGAHLFYNHMLVLEGYQRFLELLGLYLCIIFLLAGSLLLWAMINQWRFRGKQRRSRAPEGEQAFCETFGVQSENWQQWQTAKHLRVDINADGRIESVSMVAQSPKSASIIKSTE